MIQGKQGSPFQPGGRRHRRRRQAQARRTGDTLATRTTRSSWLDRIPEPAISFAIEPKSKGDEEKIGEALHRLMEEDPTSRRPRPETGEFLLSGPASCTSRSPSPSSSSASASRSSSTRPRSPTARRSAAADGHGRHKKQSGGRGQFADCRIKIEPLPRGEDFEFVDEIFGGSIPQGYRPAVEKGIQEAAQRGYLAGYPVVDFRVRLVDGQYHDVDSSEMAFKIAGSLAFKDAMAKAGVTISSRSCRSRSHLRGVHRRHHERPLTAPRQAAGHGDQERHAGGQRPVPMAEMLNYAPALNSMTQGRASFHMSYSHYEEVPRMIQDKIIAAAKKEEDG